MKRHVFYALKGTRSVLFLTMLGCLLVAGLAGVVWQPAAAAHSGDATQHPAPQFQAVDAMPPEGKAQDQTHFTPLEGGSVLELHDGKLSCRTATEEEARAMRRDHDQHLNVIREDALAPDPSEGARKGLKIILRGTEQLEQFPEAKAAFLRAARMWESLIQNPITVVIDVDFGPTGFGKSFGENQYGVTYFQWGFDENAYPTIRSALIRSAGSPQESELYNSLPPAQLPTDLGANAGMILHVAARRALGLLPPVADPNAEQATLGKPPAIGFNSAVSFDFDPSDGIKPKKIDFTASAMHEIGHALGFFSAVGNKEEYPDLKLSMEMLDLFRFRPGVTSATFATAARILSSGGEHVFFGGGAELRLSTGRASATGGDGRQSGHWKDDKLTGSYIGIMDPVFEYGTRYEISTNDLEAFERIGYRTNPLPNLYEAELKLDDGSKENGVIGNGLIVINRMTPPSYPATLRKVRMMIIPIDGQPDPAGKPITLMYGHSNPGAQFQRIETTVPSASNDLFLEFTIPDGPTINAGDFYVGFQAPSPYQGVGLGVDLNGPAENRSFFSTNNGSSFAPLSQVFQGKTTNAMIRAIVSTGIPAPPPNPVPTPTPVFTTVSLTSGVSQGGYVPRSSPTGEAFEETQYTIQVPSGATQLKIDLNANTDLDLYVRFGSRVVIQNDNPLADFKSVSDNYHESITITPGSSPALKAGIYYLMVINYGPGPSTFKITATVIGGSNPAPGKVTTVSAASYDGALLASEEIVAAFGSNLATTVQVAPVNPNCSTCLPTELAGTKVLVKDSGGTERLAPLFFVSPNQINYLIPYGTFDGTATVTVTSGDGTVSVGSVQITDVAPALFTANGDGQGAPAAVALRVKANGQQIYEPVAQLDSVLRRFVTRPLDLSQATDDVYLILYGTGLRNNQTLSTVSVKIGGVEAQATYLGPLQYYAGLDQVNVRLPRSLIGRGEVDLILTVDGRTANKLRINIK